MNERGFTGENWDRLAVWNSGCAERQDVDAGHAVFALGDTLNGQPMGWSLPQPVIWFEDEEEFAAVVVQAERHDTAEGKTLEVLGLVLPTGRSAVAFTDDVDEVEASDPVWLSLIEAELDSSEEGADDDRLA